MKARGIARFVQEARSTGPVSQNLELDFYLDILHLRTHSGNQL
jgi:hypothetical protein